ncbi:MAG: response regulator transcription factor, partial [Pirellulaceae bacterium]
SLPGRDGLDIIASLRARGFARPIMILTARDGIDDRVAGLDGGADDYVVKPFAHAELLARLRALLRRGGEQAATKLTCDDLEIDLLTRRVIRSGSEVELSQREFDLLEYLVRHRNFNVTREMLARDVWKDPLGLLTNVIDVCINSLRKKLDLPGTEPLIHTVRGVGYIVKDDKCEG